MGRVSYYHLPVANSMLNERKQIVSIVCAGKLYRKWNVEKHVADFSALFIMLYKRNTYSYICSCVHHHHHFLSLEGPYGHFSYIKITIITLYITLYHNAVVKIVYCTLCYFKRQNEEQFTGGGLMQLKCQRASGACSFVFTVFS